MKNNILFILVSIFIFIIFITFIIYIKNSYKYFITNKYKIINIIIYNIHSEYERMMKKELNRLGTLYKDNVTQIFVCFNNNIFNNNNINDTVILDDDILYIKGEESFIPGILDKTIKAIEYCNKKYEYDYIIRSNISTVIDFKRLPLYQIPLNKIGYGSSNIMKLRWLDQVSGIHDDSLFGTKFAHGINIILNKMAVEYIVNNIKKINMNIIDDISIGSLMQNVTTPVELSKKTVYNKINYNGIVFRNKSKNRYDDVERIKQIVDMIINR
jgi:hypothetical protein